MIAPQKVVKRLFPAGLAATSCNHNMVIQPSEEGWMKFKKSQISSESHFVIFWGITILLFTYRKTE